MPGASARGMLAAAPMMKQATSEEAAVAVTRSWRTVFCGWTRKLRGCSREALSQAQSEEAALAVTAFCGWTRAEGFVGSWTLETHKKTEAQNQQEPPLLQLCKTQCGWTELGHCACRARALQHGEAPSLQRPLP